MNINFIIKKLLIKNFRTLYDNKYEFKPTINYIIADNESGKSTLIDAIYTAFYIPTNSTSKNLGLFTKSWNTDLKPYIELEFRYKNQECVLIKDFANKDELLIIDGKKILKPKQILEEMNKMIGIANPELFRSLGIISGGEISDIKPYEKLVAELSKITSGTNTNTSKVLGEIDKYIQSLVKGSSGLAKNPGIISQLNEKIKDLNNIILTKKIDYQNVISLHKEKAIIEKNNEKYNSDLKLNKKLLENSNISIAAAEELSAVEQEIKNKFNEKNEIEELKSAIVKIDNEQANTKYTKDELKKLQSEIREIDSRILNIENFKKSEIDKFKILEKEKTEQYHKSNNNISKTIISITPSIVLFVLGLIVNFVLNYNLILSIIFFLAAFAYLVFFVLLKSDKKGSEYKYIDEEFDKKIIEFDNTLELLKTQTIELYKKFNFESEADIVAAIGQIDSLLLRKAEIQALIDKRQTNIGVNDYTSLLSFYNSNIQNLQIKKTEIENTKIIPYKNKVVDAKDLIELEEKVLDIEDKISEFENNLAEINGKLSVKNDSIEAIYDLEEQLSDYERQLNYYNNELESAKIARDIVNQAISNTSKTASSIFKFAIEEYLPIISNGKYSRAHIDDQYNISIYSNEKKDFVFGPPEISKGTYEQIYLLCKIAFYNLISNNNFPPIFMDDPFVLFDNNRIKHGYEVLKKISEKQQILLFSARDYGIEVK